MQRRVKDGFSTLLPAADVVQIFGERIKLSCIKEVPHAQLRLGPVLNLKAQNDTGTPSVNKNTDREITPESMQFRPALPHILQVIWEADPTKGPVWVSKLDVTDAYHCGRLQLSQVGAFACVLPWAPDDDCIIICVDLVLTMGWVD